MHPNVRTLGKLLRLVGISSPEDAAAAPASAVGDPPSWRTKSIVHPTNIKIGLSDSSEKKNAANRDATERRHRRMSSIDFKYVSRILCDLSA
jgi:hypothetical protein